VVSPIDVGLYLAESSFYFAGFCLLFDQEIEIVNRQYYPRAAGPRKQAGILIGAMPNVEGTRAGNPQFMEVTVKEIILLGAKKGALSTGNIKGQSLPLAVGMPDEGVAQLLAKVKQTRVGIFRSLAIQQYPVHRMILSEKVIYFFEDLRGHDSCYGRV